MEYIFSQSFAFQASAPTYFKIAAEWIHKKIIERVRHHLYETIVGYKPASTGKLWPSPDSFRCHFQVWPTSARADEEKKRRPLDRLDHENGNNGNTDFWGTHPSVAQTGKHQFNPPFFLLLAFEWKYGIGERSLTIQIFRRRNTICTAKLLKMDDIERILFLSLNRSVNCLF